MEMVISRHILVLDTSIFKTSNSEWREYHQPYWKETFDQTTTYGLCKLSASQDHSFYKIIYKSRFVCLPGVLFDVLGIEKTLGTRQRIAHGL